MANNLRDTEAEDSPNIMWEINVGAPLIIAFAGHAIGLNELANFEFVRTTKGLNLSKIFVRDPYRAYYHRGIDGDILKVRDLHVRLEELIAEMRPSRITCIGVSAGGYGAILYGHLLKADTVHAFGPQVILYKEWGRKHNDPTIYNREPLHAYVSDIAPEDDFRDLAEVLKSHNGKTVYNIHVGHTCQQDANHANHIEACPGVRIFRHPCEGHACAAKYLRGINKLTEVILE